MKTLKSIFKSQAKKIINANKAKLSHAARQVYLHGLARLCNAEAVAASGNRGRGFKTTFLFFEPRIEKQTKY